MTWQREQRKPRFLWFSLLVFFGGIRWLGVLGFGGVGVWFGFGFGGLNFFLFCFGVLVQAGSFVGSWGLEESVPKGMFFTKPQIVWKGLFGDTFHEV